MQFLTFQDQKIPLSYVTAFSYSKNSKVITNSAGYARFTGFLPPEISVRLEISIPRAMVADRNLMDDLNYMIAFEPNRESAPTHVQIGSSIIYPSLLFRVTSINKTIQCDRNGFPEIAEFDLVLSGVQCAKNEVRARKVIDNDDVPLPELTITCSGKSLKIGNNTAISSLILKPFSCECEILIGNDLDLVSDNGWLLSLVENSASLTIDGYGVFYIISASLVEGALKITASKWTKEAAMPITRTYFDKTLGEILGDVSKQNMNNSRLSIDQMVSYYMAYGSPVELVAQIVKSAGILMDSNDLGISFFNIPDAINPNIDFDLYLDDDLKTEPINSIIWRDSIHEYSIGDSVGMIIDSAFTSKSDIHARNCLKFARYMQNKIEIAAPIDTRIKHHSCFNIMKNGAAIPVMVEDYTFNFIDNIMNLELHYIAR